MHMLAHAHFMSKKWANWVPPPQFANYQKPSYNKIKQNENNYNRLFMIRIDALFTTSWEVC